MSEEEPNWFTRYVKTHDQNHQEIETSLRAITDNIGKWVDEIMNIKSLLDRIIRMEIKHYEEMIEQLEKEDPQHFQLKDLKRRIRNWEEIREFYNLKREANYPEWCKPSDCPRNVDCSECPHKPPDPIEIIVERTHTIIKFENETKRYKYLDAKFTEPNQLILTLEEWRETPVSCLEDEVIIGIKKMEIEIIEHEFNLWSLKSNPSSYINKSSFYQRRSMHNTGINLHEFLADITCNLFNGNTEQLEIIIKHKQEE